MHSCPPDRDGAPRFEIHHPPWRAGEWAFVEVSDRRNTRPRRAYAPGEFRAGRNLASFEHGGLARRLILPPAPNSAIRGRRGTVSEHLQRSMTTERATAPGSQPSSAGITAGPHPPLGCPATPSDEPANHPHR